VAGYVTQRGKNSWRLEVSHGFDMYGNRIRYSKTIKAKSNTEANKQLDLFVAEIENGMVAEGKQMTFLQFTKMWTKDYGTKELAPTTYARYKQMLDSRILPYFRKLQNNRDKTNAHYKFL